MVECPICSRNVPEHRINAHIDSGCVSDILEETSTSQPNAKSTGLKPGASSFFSPRATQSARPDASLSQRPPSFTDARSQDVESSTRHVEEETHKDSKDTQTIAPQPLTPLKRSLDAHEHDAGQPPQKKAKQASAFEKAQPLAERMRPKELDEVCGQELVGPNGVLRGLIESDRVPSMVLWGGPGTGKTTIARLIAKTAGTRFVEINSTSSGVAECKKLFAEARNELALTGRKTIIFCDEIHRFSKSQQDVFLMPVEAGHVTLIGATTENPSFKVVNALLSRCRTFTLSKLTTEDIVNIMRRALDRVFESSQEKEADDAAGNGDGRSHLLNDELLEYLSAFADGDARTALNLLELAVDLSKRPDMNIETLKRSLTHTLVYDRAGDQHYDTISAFHKAVRGSDPDATLYYLARMIQSGEDALYIARRMVVIASEDIGLADNSMLSLATATYTAAEKIGLPEARINLAHCAVALALSPKSTRAYRGLSNAMAALNEPGIAGLPIPLHVRNAPTRLMKEIGYGKNYKYNPDYVDGKVLQQYLPEQLLGRRFLEHRDLGVKQDPDLDEERETLHDNESPAQANEGRAAAGAKEGDDDSYVIGDGHIERYL